MLSTHWRQPRKDHLLGGFFFDPIEYEFLVAIRTHYLSALCAALWLICAGCAEPVMKIKTSGSAKITIDGTTKQTSGKALLGNEATIVLPAPSKPGYVWQITAHNSRFLRQLSLIKPVGDPAGESTVSFLAILAGTTKIRFTLVESDNKAELSPVDIQEVALAIN